MTDDEWTIRLAQGEWFEENVTRPWLLKNRTSWWVTDTRNHLRRGGKGPRMAKGNDELVLPDFRLDDPETGRSSWLDSKVKSQPFRIDGHPGQLFYSLDPMGYQKYTKLMRIFKHMPMEILMGCTETHILRLIDLRSAIPVMHEFNNQHVRYGRRLTPCFSTDQMQTVGLWSSKGMPRASIGLFAKPI